MSYLDAVAGDVYLAFNVAVDYPEQCPEYKLARWFDLFWLVIPIGGFVLFCEISKARGRANGSEG